MGSFDLLYADAKQKAQAIIQPALDALDIFEQTVENDFALVNATLAGTQVQLADANAQIQADAATIAALSAQLAAPPLWGLQDFHMHSDWKSNVGPTIGSTAPTTYGFKILQSHAGSPYALLFFAQQTLGSYGDVLISVHRPPSPPAGKLNFSGRFWMDANGPLGLQALEIDTKVNEVGFQFNLSSHIKFPGGGLLEIDGPGGWHPTGIAVGVPTALAWHEFLWEYTFDPIAKNYTFLAFTLDGTRYPIPSAVATFSALASNWSDGIHPQLQFSLNNKGLLVNTWFDRLRYVTPA